MLKCILLVVLLQWSTHGLKTSAKEETKTLCVISEDANYSCLPINGKQVPCYPLSIYIRNVSKYFTNDTEMIFMAGTHHLHLPPDSTPVVTITGISNFSMIGHGNVTYNRSEDCLLYTSPSPRDATLSRMPSSA